MREFLLRWIVNTISLFVATALLPGVEVNGSLVLVALLIGVINSLLRPILYLASCGCIVLTLGLIIPILNALLLLLADELAGSSFEIDGLGWAVLAAIVMGIINAILGSVLGIDDKEKKKYAD